MPDSTAAHYAAESAALIAAYRQAAPAGLPPTPAERLVCGRAVVTEAMTRTPNPGAWWDIANPEQAEDVISFVISVLPHGTTAPPGELAHLVRTIRGGAVPQQPTDSVAAAFAVASLVDYAATFGAEPAEVLSAGLWIYLERLRVCALPEHLDVPEDVLFSLSV